MEWKLFSNCALVPGPNVRVIAPDRPGLGDSHFQFGRRITDWPADVIALAKRLQLPSFGILAYSGGCPYALACALKIPERLTRVVIVSGTAPFDKPGLCSKINPHSLRFMQLARSKPWRSRLSIGLMRMAARYAPHTFIKRTISSMSAPDRTLLADPVFQQGFLKLINDTLRAASRGAQWDLALTVGPWEFSPGDVKLPVDLWHGEEDANAPLAMARYMAEVIPSSKPHFLAGEGHLSLMAKHLKQIVNQFYI